MNSLTLLQLLLVLHITGFTMMAGTFVAAFSVSRKLNKYLITDRTKAITILEGTTGFPLVMGIGGILLIATGLGMVAQLREAVTSMLWFRIKMALVILVLINTAAMANPTLVKLRKSLVKGDGGIDALRGRLQAVYILQLLLFLAIFILSVFRF